MSEKRFELDVRLDMPKLLIDNATNKRYHLLLVNDIVDIVDLLNEQQDQISYWKHKVNGLLWILSQFDEEKVKELLKEVEDDNKMFMQRM